MSAVLQLEVLKQHLDGGGGILVMLGEGGEMKYDTNINFLLEEFGIMINNGECDLVLMSSVHHSLVIENKIFTFIQKITVSLFCASQKSKT